MSKQESKRSEKPSEAPVQNLPVSKDRVKKKTKGSEKAAEDASPINSAARYRAAGGNQVLEDHTKKRLKEEKELHTQQLQPSENTSKASKKRKRKDDEDIVANLNEPQRKKRNRTEFADPREDESLGSQCRKALEYAFTQMNKPSKWKFNKARQNWIIRNAWSPETLPDAYFPLVLKYLSKVQGGSRTKLKEIAENHLIPTEAPSKSDNMSAKAVNFETPPEATLSKVKLHPGPLIVGPTSTSGTLVDPLKIVAIADKKAAHSEIIQARARQIIAVLSSSENA